jgi:regulatory protein
MPSRRPAAPLSASQVLARLARFCADRERSPAEVVQKLYALGVHADLHTTLLERLQADGLLNETRFAHAFVRSKLAAGWGQLKIRAALRAHHLPDALVRDALAQETDDEHYAAKLQKLIAQKLRTLPPTQRTKGHSALQKVYKFLEQKGFERAAILKAMRAAGLHMDV